MKNLVIVESPAKARTISGYLGSDFEVTASYGHLRDLPTSKLGVETEDDFKPTYVIPPKSRKIVSQIKKLAAHAENVYLATDLDREGEAIAWHITQAIGLGSTKSEARNPKRITFHEITKGAVLGALKSPRQIDMHLVDAQQARRVLDRLVGYNLSPMLWRKVYKGLSAGRVQSVAVRLVVEREREIQGFKSEEFWEIIAILEKEKIKFEARLIEVGGKKLDKLGIKTAKEAEEIIKQLEGGKYIVRSVDHSIERRYPSAPHTTSTLQQEAANALGFSAKQTMRLAQNLYEAGHITYMRTDSVSLSAQALDKICQHIASEFGKEFLPESARQYKTKSKHAQEAHEAIRPADVFQTPEKLNAKLTDRREERLYELIWRRTVASQMREAELDIVEAKIESGKYLFAARGQTIRFQGFLRLYPKKIAEITVPRLEEKEVLSLVELKHGQHFTEPPARYSEATLIKALEQLGIGRPSTYAPTMGTIQDRGYVVKEKGRLRPEKVGEVVNDLLVEHFADVVDYGFTAQIETELDEVAEGKRRWQAVVGDFYGPFSKNLDHKSQTIEKQNLTEELDEKCPECGKKLLIRHSKNGRFIGCSGFPDCKYTRSLVSPEVQAKLDRGAEAIRSRRCPRCKGELKVVSGKYGPFIGCSNYPKCKYMERISRKSKVESEKSSQVPPKSY